MDRLMGEREWRIMMLGDGVVVVRDIYNKRERKRHVG